MVTSRHGDRPLSTFQRFLASESAGGIVLIVAATLALIIANSPLAPTYFSVLRIYLGPLSVQHWINDLLMAVFFLLVGLEIKRELLDGQLSTWPRRILPGLAAAGGMAAPALIYLWFNADDPVRANGWAITAATDIAFALGVLSLLGSRVPLSLKVLLTAVAVVDDLGAVVIIALFYTAGVDVEMLGLAGTTFVVLLILGRLGVRSLIPFSIGGGILWIFVLQSGVHATVAGVLLAMTIPHRPKPSRSQATDSPLLTLEHAIQPWVAFVIVPVFGFANAGVSFASFGLDVMTHPVTLGVVVGLFVGKQLGIFGAVLAAVKLGLVDRPADASWVQIYGVALLCGIGFTMSLFIGLLAFPTAPDLTDPVKIGVLMGSLASAVLGFSVLRFAKGDPAGGPRQAGPRPGC